MHFSIVTENFLGRPEGFDEIDEESLIGGAEINVYRTSQLLLEMGHEVTVVQTNAGHDVEEFDGIGIEQVSVPDPLGRLKDIAFNYQWRRAAPDESIVHLQNPIYAFPFYSDIESFNQPGLTWDYPDGFRKRNLVEKFITRQLLVNGACSRASDNSFLTYVQSQLTAHRNQVYPIPNAVDIEAFAPEPVSREQFDFDLREHVVLYPRTLGRRRGAFHLLEALARVKRSTTGNFTALFVGAEQTQIQREFKSRARQLNVAENVELVGHIPHEEISTYYNLADIVTIPTYHSEGSSIACIEAMACGNPLIVTDVGGLKELIYQDVVDGGLKIKPDSDALAAALERLIKEPDLRAEMGENSRKRVLEYYRMERWERQTKEYFRRVIEAFN